MGVQAHDLNGGRDIDRRGRAVGAGRILRESEPEVSGDPPLTGEAVIAFAVRLDETCRKRPSALWFDVIADLAIAERR